MARRNINSPAGAAAGQGYLDNLANQRKMQSSLNRQKQLEQSNQPDKSLQGGPDTRGNKDLSKMNVNQALQEFQGGSLTGRQKRLIRKGKGHKAKNIANRRRRRVLKRGGEVSSSWQASQASGRGNYKASKRVMSQDADGKTKKTRLGKGGSYDFKAKNEAKGAGGGLFAGRKRKAKSKRS